MIYKLAILLFAILLVGCSAASSRVPDPNPLQKTPPAATPELVGLPIEPATNFTAPATEKVQVAVTQPTGPLLPSGMDFLIEKSRQDLAQRLGVAVDSVTVTAVIGQEFSDNAFHCRKTTERVSGVEDPVMIPGQIILLNATGHRYEYHASGQTVIFCQRMP